MMFMIHCFPAPPGPPQNVRAARVGTDYVTLEWKPPVDDGGAKITGYKIEKSEEMSEDWRKVTEVKAFDTTFTVEKLTENVGYYFCVMAKNEVGYGEPCETDALIKPKKPEGKYKRKCEITTRERYEAKP